MTGEASPLPAVNQKIWHSSWISCAFYKMHDSLERCAYDTAFRQSQVVACFPILLEALRLRLHKLKSELDGDGVYPPSVLFCCPILIFPEYPLTH